MRRLLNTIYITNENIYLALDGENLVCQDNGKTTLRVPFDNIENIVCFNYLGCSPALMGKCVEKQIPINFLSPHGRFLAKVCGETKGNVFLRVAQIEKFKEHGLTLAQNTVAAKISNCVKVIKRSVHDNAVLRDDEKILAVISSLKKGVESLWESENADTVMGIEGNCASEYFSVFGKLIKQQNGIAKFTGRSKHPPLDPINAALSFIYTLATRDYAAALETVGIDSYIGYYHALRSGRPSLACDMVEEFRSISERFVITLFNLQILQEKDFEKQISGAVWLNEDGRKKLLTQWQEKKRSDIEHPYLKQRIPLGLLPYVQSNLMAKYLREEIAEYPCYLAKQ